MGLHIYRMVVLGLLVLNLDGMGDFTVSVAGLMAVVGVIASGIAAGRQSAESLGKGRYAHGRDNS